MQELNKYEIFSPPKHPETMKSKYHELNEIEEFNGLLDCEMRFIWYYAYPNSIYLKLSDSNRAEVVYSIVCIECSIDEKQSVAFSTMNKLKNLDFSNDIKQAIKRMSNIDIEKRIKASNSLRIAFEKITNMISLTDEEYMAITDMSERKQFVDLVSTASSLIPKLLEQSERGFGVTLKKELKKSQILNPMDVAVSISEKN